MKRKKTIIIFDEKSNCEPVALSRMRRKPETVFLILPFEYLASTDKWFRLIAENVVKDAAAGGPVKAGGKVA